jgi:hypothetical protein
MEIAEGISIFILKAQLPTCSKTYLLFKKVGKCDGNEFISTIDKKF